MDASDRQPEGSRRGHRGDDQVGRGPADRRVQGEVMAAMSHLNLQLREAENRLDLARINREAPEVIHGLMMDLAQVMDTVATSTRNADYLDAARSVRRSAMTMIPMFGMDAEFQRHEMRRNTPWWAWRQRRDWRPPDYEAQLTMYREKIY